MKQGITISTWEHGQDQCLTLLNSMSGCKYPVLIVVNHGTSSTWLDNRNDIRVIKLDEDCFELGAIKATLDNTDWDEFIFLQDTFEIKNMAVFDMLFDNYPSTTVAYNPHFQMYLGKYTRALLDRVNIPIVRSKTESIRQEDDFRRNLQDTESIPIFNPSFKDDNFYGCYEERWGRTNLVLQDEYLIKRKGTWLTSQIKD